MANRRGARKAAPPQVSDYRHDEAKRKNNPEVGLANFEKRPRRPPRQRYEYDPHRDPQLVWAGKAEHTSFRDRYCVAPHPRARERAGGDQRRQAQRRPRRRPPAARPLRRPAAPARPGGRVLRARRRLGEPPRPGRLSPRHELPAPPRAARRQGADDLHRPAVRRRVQLQLPALHPPARCARRPR